jgi:flagellar protein FlgJ
MNSTLLRSAPATPNEKELQVREKFQDFVAGTFYKQMFKALRSGQKKPAYLHGGHAEEVFQSRMDEQVAEQLAKQHGKQFSDPLYASFARDAMPASPAPSPSTVKDAYAFSAAD